MSEAEEPRARKKKRDALEWRLVPRVQDIGFFHGLLVSRSRLALGALAATTVSMVVIVLVCDWIRESSGSPSLNVLIISLMMTSVIVAAYIDALLVGDLFFPGRWREQLVQGDAFVPENWDEEQASVKEYNTTFILVVVGMVAVLGWLSQVLTGGFFSYYKNVGFALTLMRSDDAEDRLRGLESISNPLYEDYWQEEALHEQVAKLVEDGDAQVQAFAMYVAGRLGVVRAADSMLTSFRDASEEREVRGAAAMALGRMKWDKALAYLAHRLRAKDASEAEKIDIVRGLALLGDARGGESVARLLDSCEGGESRLSEELVVTGFYALRQTRYHAGSPVALKYLGGEACGATVTRQEQCAAADALRDIAQEAHLEGLQRVYPTLPSDYDCEYEIWHYANEKGVELVEAEALRSKVVRAVGNRKSYDTYEWLWNIGADERENLKTRKVAELYVRGILEAYERDKSVRRKR